MRSFKTVPGGICSIITWILLTYYIVVTVMTHSFHATYVETSQTGLLSNPSNVEYQVFNITTDQLQMYGLIYSSNLTIASNLDAYVGGVF